jgi:hypothetical protein
LTFVLEMFQSARHLKKALVGAAVDDWGGVPGVFGEASGTVVAVLSFLCCENGRRLAISGRWRGAD